MKNDWIEVYYEHRIRHVRLSEITGISVYDPGDQPYYDLMLKSIGSLCIDAKSYFKLKALLHIK